MSDHELDYETFNIEHNQRFSEAANRLQFFFEEINSILAAACSSTISNIIADTEITVEDGVNSYAARFDGVTTIRLGETLFDIVYAIAALIEADEAEAPRALTGPIAAALGNLLGELRDNTTQFDGFGPSGPLAEIGPLGPIDRRRTHYTLQFWMNVATGLSTMPPGAPFDEQLLDGDRRLKPEHQIPSGVSIRLDASAGVARLFVLAHEQAHVLLGHTGGGVAVPEIVAQATGILCSSGTFAERSDDPELQADVIGLSMVIAVMRAIDPEVSGTVITRDLQGPITVLGETFGIVNNPNHLRQLGINATHPSASDRKAILLHTAAYLGADSHPNICCGMSPTMEPG